MIINKKRLSEVKLTNFLEVLAHWNEKHPHKTVYKTINDKLEITEEITYSGLYNAAIINSVFLKQNGLKKGEKCLLVFHSAIEFMISFFACMVAELIPISVFPPKRNRDNDRFERIIEDSGAIAILSNKRLKQDLESFIEKSEIDLYNIKIILITSTNKSISGTEIPVIKSDETAFIQYTSGSTTSPNGVNVTHKNLLNNSAIIQTAFNLDFNMISTAWLPHIHDMGFIGSMLQSLYCGGINIVIPPAVFIRNPASWFKIISAYKATITGGPNFAFDHCVNFINLNEFSNIDLSSLKVMFIGSEPVYSSTIKKFCKKFKSLGFRNEMFLPCYGLAESALMVTGIFQTEKPLIIKVDEEELIVNNKIITDVKTEKSKELVSSGYPWLNHEVVIVDHHTRSVLKENQIGEIWIKGNSVSPGYINNETKTRETFHAFTSEGKGPYLRSGDLGFLRNKHLFVTGRIKDVILLRGKNYYPHDIEQSVMQSDDALQDYAGAAFSITDDMEEHLVIINEIKRSHMRTADKDQVINNINEAVAANHGIKAHTIVLVNPLSIPKTTSGKIQRNLVKSYFLNKNLKEFHKWINPGITNEISQNKKQQENSYIEFLTWLMNWMSNKLKIDSATINPENSIMSYGLDSMAAVELERDIKERFDIEIELSDFLENNKISYIAQKGFLLLNNKNQN